MQITISFELAECVIRSHVARSIASGMCSGSLVSLLQSLPLSQKMDLSHTPEHDAFDALQAVSAVSSPFRLRGKVVNGFGRGSKLLGCPTANLDPEAFKDALHGVQRGVYMGYASVSGGPVYKAVLSLGTAPTFGDQVSETVEAYILHEFPADFYGEELALIIVGFMRTMEKYTALDELIRAIARDVRVGDTQLEKSPFVEYREDPFFKESSKEKRSTQ